MAYDDYASKTFEDIINDRIDYADKYRYGGANASSSSQVDVNANVTRKSIGALQAEMYKEVSVIVSRALMHRNIEMMFDEELADEYIDMLDKHIIYTNDEAGRALGMPYCVSISLYPMLLDGLDAFGGISSPPQHLDSFVGQLPHLLYSVSSGFAGAIAIGEFFIYFDYFARKDYGDDYLETHTDQIAQFLQHFIYSINQPSIRGAQSLFTNVSLYDDTYLKTMFGSFAFPDGTPVDYEGVKEIQRFFVGWFREEKKKKLLTFPVVTQAYLRDEHTNEILDVDFLDMMADDMSKGGSSFMYCSDTPDSLSSCCRLKNVIFEDMTKNDDNEFSFSLGGGGVQTGSISVYTINANRATQLDLDFEDIIKKIHKFQVVYRAMVQENIDRGMMPTYTGGFIDIDKQFSTIGINGHVEAAEFLGMKPRINDKEYVDWIKSLFNGCTRLNKEARKEYGFKFNTELIPAESVAVKFFEWDKRDGFVVPDTRECYSSYIYAPEDPHVNIFEKAMLHGGDIIKGLDGGSAYHCNLGEIPSKEQCLVIIKEFARLGVEYWVLNVKMTCCNSCGSNDYGEYKQCTTCGSEDVDYATRIIGYIKKIKHFSADRQKEESIRSYNS